MPYLSNAALPHSVRAHLPEHAQTIYREAFNHTYAAHS
jgi:cation transport regulator